MTIDDQNDEPGISHAEAKAYFDQKKAALMATMTPEELEELRVRREQAAAWREENAEAIECLNEFTRKHGLFSDEFRKF